MVAKLILDQDIFFTLVMLCSCNMPNYIIIIIIIIIIIFIQKIVSGHVIMLITKLQEKKSHTIDINK